MSDAITVGPEDPKLLLFRAWAETNEVLFEEDILEKDMDLRQDVPELIAYYERIGALTGDIIRWVSIELIGIDSVGVAKIRVYVQYKFLDKVYALDSEFGVQVGDKIPLRFLFVSQDPVLADTLDKGLVLFEVKRIHGEFLDIGPVVYPEL